MGLVGKTISLFLFLFVGCNLVNVSAI